METGGGSGDGKLHNIIEVALAYVKTGTNYTYCASVYPDANGKFAFTSGGDNASGQYLDIVWSNPNWVVTTKKACKVISQLDPNNITINDYSANDVVAQFPQSTFQSNDIKASFFFVVDD